MYVFNVPFPRYSHRECQTSENSCLYTVVELFCPSATCIITLDSYSDLNIPLMVTVTYALEWLVLKGITLNHWICGTILRKCRSL